MSPITSLSQESTFIFPTSTSFLSFYSLSPTPYDHIAPYQSIQSSQDTIQTIIFGTLGILFAIASVFLGYLQLRHMHRTPTMPLELPVRNNGRFSLSSYSWNETNVESGRTLSAEIEVQPSVETERVETPSDGRTEESRAESVNEIRAVSEAHAGSHNLAHLS